jgi:ubiquinone/menaquinone biosynthesis C-methylase UbiE
MARWRRAQRWLPPAPARILDCGCGTGLLTRRMSSASTVVGTDHFLPVLRVAQRSAPLATFCCATLDRLPFADGSFDAAACLDVLEHVDDPAAVVGELARVIRSGGMLVVSMPHRGVLAGSDSHNLYQRLFPHRNSPTDDPSWRVKQHHAHVSLDELQALLGERFEIVRVARTGTGLPELFNLLFLMVTRAVSPRLNWLHYAVLGRAYNLMHVIDDAVPMGRAGYSITIAARRGGPSTTAAPSAPSR